MHQGKEYDYVFDVDTEDGKPPLKLTYNKSQNPYQAAQEFIYQNDLPQSYLDQVANFITKNVKDVTIGVESSGNVDPFTTYNHDETPAPAEQKRRSLIPITDYSLLKTANLNAILKKIIDFNSNLEKNLV